VDLFCATQAELDQPLRGSLVETARDDVEVAPWLATVPCSSNDGCMKSISIKQTALNLSFWKNMINIRMLDIRMSVGVFLASYMSVSVSFSSYFSN
jgi:hypothetical protein